MQTPYKSLVISHICYVVTHSKVFECVTRNEKSDIVPDIVYMLVVPGSGSGVRKVQEPGDTLTRATLNNNSPNVSPASSQTLHDQPVKVYALQFSILFSIVAKLQDYL